MILRFANIKLNSKEDSTLRKEIKITSNKQDSDIILQKLETKKAKEIYQEREVNSVYLDTHSFKMFNDSVEGIIPRKKIR
ncbi:VTC domain-containing protein, partial [Alphaproteobacteria bacterium]|nr:VTC domain-containing protein [Alphaproteobacteria bacterium]